MSALGKPQVQFPHETPALPEQGLVDAYRVTDFVVETEEAMVLRVDSPVPLLGRWLAARRCESAVVITASNPFSRSLPGEENLRRNRELLTAIEATGLLSASAIGRARSDNWEPEVSFCVFDVAPDVVDAWMRRFGQYAVVLAEKEGTCRLLWHPAIRVAMNEAEAS